MWHKCLYLVLCHEPAFYCLSKPHLFFNDDLLCLWLQSVQYDLKHDFVWVTDEADCSVVLALLQVAFLGKCDDEGLVHGVGRSSVCQTLLEIVVTPVITTSPSTWTSSAGMLPTPAGFPFFNDCTAASTSLRRMGWSSSVCVWGQFSTDGFPFAL